MYFRLWITVCIIFKASWLTSNYTKTVQMSATTLLHMALSLGCWGNTSCLNNSASDNLCNNFWQAVTSDCFVPSHAFFHWKKSFRQIIYSLFLNFTHHFKKLHFFLFNQKSLVPFNHLAFLSKVEGLLKNSLLLITFLTVMIRN